MLKQLTVLFVSLFAIVSLSAPPAFAGCTKVTRVDGGLRISQDAGFVSGLYQVQTTPAGLSVSLEVAAKKSGGVSSGRFILAENEYTQMKLQTISTGSEGLPTAIDAGGVDGYSFPGGDYLIVVRGLEGNGTYTTTIISQLTDVSAPQVSCIAESEWDITYLDFTYGTISQMPGSHWVDLTDYSLPCPLSSTFCGGPYILSPITTVEGDLKWQPGSAPGGSASIQLLGGIQSLLTQASVERTVELQKAALRQARNSAERYLSTRTTANRGAVQAMRSAIRSADRATRRSARAREVGAAIRGLRLSLIRIS